MSKMTLNIADINIDFNSDIPNIRDFVDTVLYSPFITDPNSKTDLCIEIISSSSLPKLSAEKCIFSNNVSFSVFKDKEGYYIADSRETKVKTDRVIFLSHNGTVGKIFIHDDSYYITKGQTILTNPLEQTFFAWFLGSAKDGCIVHASSAMGKGENILILGHSGEGKSTLSSILFENGYQILNDDRIILRETEQGFNAYGTPWHGTFDKYVNSGAPVTKVLLLNQSDENSIRRLSNETAYKEILTRIFLPFGDKELVLRIMDMLTRLSNDIPFYRLDFTKDSSVLKTIEDAHIAQKP